MPPLDDEALRLDDGVNLAREREASSHTGTAMSTSRATSGHSLTSRFVRLRDERLPVSFGLDALLEVRVLPFLRPLATLDGATPPRSLEHALAQRSRRFCPIFMLRATREALASSLHSAERSEDGEGHRWRNVLPTGSPKCTWSECPRWRLF